MSRAAAVVETDATVGQRCRAMHGDRVGDSLDQVMNFIGLPQMHQPSNRVQTTVT
jgi:hypothetical protein